MAEKTGKADDVSFLNAICSISTYDTSKQAFFLNPEKKLEKIGKSFSIKNVFYLN